MAIQLSATSPTGATGNYWRITCILIDRVNSIANVYAALYLDSTARQSNSVPLEIKTYQFSDSLFVGATNALQTAYTQLMSFPDFSGGTQI